MTTYDLPVGQTYNLFTDMLEQSHLLVAGASGSGKSVLVNGLICTMLYDSPFNQPGGKQFVLIDPKRTELHPYKKMPHCLYYASEPKDMVEAFHFALGVVERRYERMEENGLRKYTGSDIYVIIEELADLMTTQRHTVQPLIQRLCQIARAARVHVIAVTQCPLVAVIPTPIKVNFDGIVALRTRSAQDSRNIIGVSGAELLPRYGDCLYITPDMTTVGRYRVPFIDDAEQARLIHWWAAQVKTEAPKKGFFARLFGR